MTVEIILGKAHEINIFIIHTGVLEREMQHATRGAHRKAKGTHFNKQVGNQESDPWANAFISSQSGVHRQKV